MAKKKKNQHIMYRCNWHPQSYSEQARDSANLRINLWIAGNKWYDFKIVLWGACNSYRCDIVKHRMIKGLRRYGKRKGLI
jgi:hypothetical protein